MSKLPARIEDKIIPEPMSGCWLWLGAVDKDGYGKTSDSASGLKRYVRAHRLVYELLVGSIPEGENLLHSCDNPYCVNPDHLWPGSQADNVRDRDRKGRTNRAPCPGEKNNRAILNEAKVIEIRASKEPLKVLADRYGVSVPCIKGVRGRVNWKHVEDLP
jgi:hypothetical protein